MSEVKRKAGRPLKEGAVKAKYVKVRTDDEEREAWKEKARKKGYTDLSRWIRSLVNAS